MGVDRCLGPYSRTSCKICKSIFLQLFAKKMQLCGFFANSYSRIILSAKSCRLTRKKLQLSSRSCKFADFLQVEIFPASDSDTVTVKLKVFKVRVDPLDAMDDTEVGTNNT